LFFKKELEHAIRIWGISEKDFTIKDPDVTSLPLWNRATPHPVMRIRNPSHACLLSDQHGYRLIADLLPVIFW